VWIQKALFYPSLPCGLFCCLFCLFQSGTRVWTAWREREGYLTPQREFRSCFRWALCRLWSWDWTLICVPHWNVSEQVFTLSLSFFCCLLGAVLCDNVRLMLAVKAQSVFDLKWIVYPKMKILWTIYWASAPYDAIFRCYSIAYRNFIDITEYFYPCCDNQLGHFKFVI